MKKLRILKWFRASDREYVLRDMTAHEERGEPSKAIGWVIGPVDCDWWAAITETMADSAYKARESAQAAVCLMLGVSTEEVAAMQLAEKAFKPTHAIDIAQKGKATRTVLAESRGLGLYDEQNRCIGAIRLGKFVFVYELLGLTYDEEANIAVRPYVK